MHATDLCAKKCSVTVMVFLVLSSSLLPSWCRRRSLIVTEQSFLYASEESSLNNDHSRWKRTRILSLDLGCLKVTTAIIANYSSDDRFKFRWEKFLPRSHPGCDLKEKDSTRGDLVLRVRENSDDSDKTKGQNRRCHAIDILMDNHLRGVIDLASR